MLFTTSLRAGEEAKKLARALAQLFPFGKSLNRGKKKIGELVKKAREGGKSRVCIIFEQGGKPAKISFISVSEEGWEWMKPGIAIEGWKSKRMEQGAVCGIAVTGPKGKVFEKLIDYRNMKEIAGEGEKDETMAVNAGKNAISAKFGSKAIFHAKVKWL
jgi:hypothetical protein